MPGNGLELASGLILKSEAANDVRLALPGIGGVHIVNLTNAEKLK